MAKFRFFAWSRQLRRRSSAEKFCSNCLGLSFGKNFGFSLGVGNCAVARQPKNSARNCLGLSFGKNFGFSLGVGNCANVWDTYFYEKNLQGDIVAVYTSTGVKKISYAYDAWGKTTTTYYNGATASNLKNPFTYRGYYYDNDLGFYYLNSRYYDSNTGRFINADKFVSTGQGLLGYNMYSYCNNNPIMYVDYNGEFLIGLLVTVAVAFACYVFVVDSVISDAPSNIDISDELWESEDENKRFVYYDISSKGKFDNTTKIESEVGLYTEEIEINDYNLINYYIGKAEASVGYNGASLEMHLGEISFKNNAVQIFNKKVSTSFSLNSGVGFEFSFGAKTEIGISFLFGGSLTIEVYE